MRLPDGRVVSYAEYGALEGPVLFLFHGLPGSRLAVEDLWPDPDGPGAVRVIAPDRPGMGRSDFQPGRRLTGYAADIAALADELGLERFSVAGFSGGGPHALAVAHGLPDRVIAAGCLGGSGQFDDPHATEGLNRANLMIARLARTAPPALRLILAMHARSIAKDPVRVYDRSARDTGIAAADRVAMADPRARRLATAAAAEAFRQGTRGAVQEARICFTAWGFDPATIKVPVHVWHGETDTNVPVAMARRIADLVPGARLTIYPQEGHLFVASHWDEIISTLVP